MTRRGPYRDAPLVAPARPGSWREVPWGHVVPAVLLPLFELASAQTPWEVTVLPAVIGALLVLVTWALPMQGILIVHQGPAAARALGRVSRVWFASVLATVGAGVLVRVWAADHDRVVAERVSAAVEQYHLEWGTYPERLEALVPQYLAEVPRAHLRSGVGCVFQYERVGGEPMLGRLDHVPEVGCTMNDGDVYDFTAHRWARCGGTRCPATPAFLDAVRAAYAR